MDYIYIYIWTAQEWIIGFATFIFRPLFTLTMSMDRRNLKAEAALRSTLERAGEAMRDVDRVYRDMGWGTLIPKTPAAPGPFATPVGSGLPGPRLGSTRADTAMAGITPVEDTVSISRTEFEQFRRFKAMEARERDIERKGRGRDRATDQDRAREGRDRETNRVGRREQGRDRSVSREKDRRSYKDDRRKEEGGTRNHEGGASWDERRRLGRKCGKCGGLHPSRQCRRQREELKCDYPPCVQKTGHLSVVCHELMKRCRLPVCKNARGHRTSSHYQPEDVLPYGDDERAARELRRIYADFLTCLTGEERRVIRRYEESNRSADGHTEKEKRE